MIEGPTGGRSDPFGGAIFVFRAKRADRRALAVSGLGPQEIGEHFRDRAIMLKASGHRVVEGAACPSGPAVLGPRSTPAAEAGDPQPGRLRCQRLELPVVHRHDPTPSDRSIADFRRKLVCCLAHCAPSAASEKPGAVQARPVGLRSDTETRRRRFVEN